MLRLSLYLVLLQPLSNDRLVYLLCIRLNTCFKYSSCDVFSVRTIFFQCFKSMQYEEKHLEKQIIYKMCFFVA